MYDKPKVTIDLEEYNSLLSEKERVKGDELVQMTQTVIASFINNKGEAARTMDDLKRKGILFVVNQHASLMSNGILPEHITISKIKE